MTIVVSILVASIAFLGPPSGQRDAARCVHLADAACAARALGDVRLPPPPGVERRLPPLPISSRLSLETSAVRGAVPDVVTTRLRNIGIGAVAGLVVGATAGAIVGASGDRSCRRRADSCNLTLIDAVAFGFSGMVLGGAIGAVLPVHSRR